MRDMYWLTSPTFGALYTLLLVVIVAITVVRAGLLSWRLFGGVPRRRILLARALDGSVSADDLARAAIANLVSHKTPPTERVDPDTALRTLRAADARFDYLWRRLAIRVSSTRSLMRLTLIAAAFVTSFGFFPTWQYFMFGDRAGGDTIAGVPAYIVQALYETGEWSLARLSLGLGVAGGLCVVTMVFDRLLQHRLASWKYLYATAGDTLSGGKQFE